MWRAPGTAGGPPAAVGSEVAGSEVVTEQLMIVATGLRKSFPIGSGAEVEAVAGIDLRVARGECFGLLGPNDAGKSSTMRMIA